MFGFSEIKNKIIPPPWYKGGGGGGWNPSPEFLIWWWHCWRPMTSPTMVAILDFTKNKKYG